MIAKKDNSVTPHAGPLPLALTPEAAALKPAPAAAPPPRAAPSAPIAEDGGPAGPEPTRFGDWERKGRCSDF